MKHLFRLMILLLIGTLIAWVSQVYADDGVTSCYTRTDGGVVFTFSNIPDAWLGDLGWYFIGDDVTLDGHTLTVIGLQFDEGYSYAIVGAADMSESYTASTEISPDCRQKKPTPAEIPIPVLPTAAPEIQSTGRVCTVHYPSLIVVCNGV